ncbi:MAG: ClbS/DfsB family four-helix bundle protein [bacterium]
MDTITFFKNLKESDWIIPVTEKLSVKDVFSHLVGWEREVAQELVKTFETGNEPWFMSVDNFDEFNEKIYQEFKNTPPPELLLEMNRWQKKLENAILKIGEDKIRQRSHVDWVFDDGDEPHFEHHKKQVENVLKIKDV